MWKNPAGNFVGWAVLSKAPWSAITSTRRPVILPSFEHLCAHDVVAGEPVETRFSVRFSTHLTGTPATIEPAIAHT